MADYFHSMDLYMESRIVEERLVADTFIQLTPMVQISR